MIKISTETRSIMMGNHFLQWGLSYGLFNLSQVADYIKPLLESRTKKSVTRAAILMTLSRLAREQRRIKVKTPRYAIENINVYSNLSVATFQKNPIIHEKITLAYAQVKKTNAFITVTEGIHEVTVILEHATRRNFLKDEKPKKEYEHVTAVSIKFSPKQSDAPGFLHQLLQLLTLQSINIIEVSSTYTEIVFYVASTDAKLAFDTFYSALM